MELPHVGALDGLRGVAVLAVILYHGGVSWLGGGFLGVEMFFVLSGFLITSLLVAEWLDRGHVVLRSFWLRRARRLLPALIVVVVVIGLYYAVSGPAKAIPGLLGNGLAALFYYSNWHQIATGTNYFAASGPVSPFQHTWSLAIEEQFYMMWPLLLLAVVGVVRRRRGSLAGSLRALLGVALFGLVASAVEMAVLYDGGAGLNRVYYGTDTRATGLLAGAALAICLALRRHAASAVASDAETAATIATYGETATGDAPPAAAAAKTGVVRRRLAGLGGVAILALLGVAMSVATGTSSWLFPWGFLAVDLAVVLVIASVVSAPRALTNRILSLPPLQATGRISYGLYLWHFPLFLWLDAAATGLSGTRLLALRFAITLIVAGLSYTFVEQPIRQRRRPTWIVGWLAPLGAGGAVASLLAASAASALPTAVPAAATLPAVSTRLTGSASCTETLTDTAGYGVAAVPARSEAQFEYTALGKHDLIWSGSSQKTFATCPPKRIMLIGDSIAFTLGVPMLEDEQKYGVEVANAAILGCSFATRGELDINGTWEPQEDGCQDPLKTWAAQEHAFHPAEVVIELGYRDEFNWRWNGRVVHLGDPAFDAYVQRQIDEYVKVLGHGGTKLLFLDVPFTDPPSQANGSPAPAASPARHSLINAMIARAAARDKAGATVLSLDRTISPGDHYDAKVDGQECRFDGIHVSLFCGELLEEKILPAARKLIERP